MTVSQLVKLYCIGVFVLLLGVGLIVGSLYASIDERRIERKGVPCMAVLMSSKHEQDSQGRNSYFVKLEYPLSRDDIHSQWFEVPEPVHAKAVARKRLPIRFDRAHPGDIVFEDFPYNVPQRCLVGAVLAVIGLVVLLFAIGASLRKTGSKKDA